MPDRAASARGIAWLLAAMSAIGPFAIDTYLPAFASIGHDLGGSPLAVQQTLTAYLATFAVMSLWHGALSDSLGRRRVALWSIAGFALSSLACAAATTIEQLWAGRALQGVCGGAGLVLGRAVARDLFEGARAQRLLAQVTMIFAVAPAVAPLIGGQLHAALGWRAIFVFLALYAAALWLVCLRALPETLAVAARQPLRAASLARGFGAVLRDRVFWCLASAIAVNFAGFFLYVLAAPAFLGRHLGLSEQAYFWLFGPTVVGTIGGSWLASRLAGRLDPARTIAWGLGGMLAAALLNLAINLAAPASLPWAIVPIPLYTIGMALSSPSLTLLILDRFGERRGTAASCQSFLQSSLNTLTAGVIAPLAWGATLHLAAAQAVLIALGIALSLLGRRLARRGRAAAAASI